MARKIVYECIKCFKNNPIFAQTLTEELPKTGVSQTMPFHNTRVDYGGPFMIKDRKGRGSKTRPSCAYSFVSL